MNKKLITTLLMAALLAGCSNDDLIGTAQSGDELKLTASVDVRTRATATAFESGDCIGLYAMAWTDASPSVQIPLATPYYAANVKFKWDDSGFVNQQTAIYWPVKTRKLDLYAYYPYSETGLAEDNTLSIAVESDQSVTGNYTKSDFMTARLMGNERTKEALVLPFRHALSKVKFTLVPGTGYSETELAQFTLKLKQFNTTAIIDLSKTSDEDGFLTSVTTPADIALTATREAIIMPQTKIAGESLFTLGYADGTIVVTSSAEEGKNVFEAGKQYNYTLKVSRVGMNIVAEIMDWEVVDFEEISRTQMIDITTDIGGTESERAETFAENDGIGIFQKNGEELIGVNRSFVWKEGKLTGEPLYWPDNGTKVTLYGYYPYTAALGSTSLAANVAQNQNTSAALAMSDVKTALLTTEHSTSGNVIMSFNHAFSKIVVNLVKGDGFTDTEIAGMTVTLPQMMTTAAIDLTRASSDEKFIINVGDEKDITPFSNNNSKSAIVVPQIKTVGSDLFNVKTASGVLVTSYKAEIDRNIFSSGKQYIFTLRLNRADMRVNAEIVNWVETGFNSEAEQAMELTTDIGGVEGGTNESFNINDKIGIYARFDDVFAHNNLAYTWGTNGLTGETIIYWPDRGTIVDLYAYYPYKASGLENGTTILKSELAADQTTDAAYSGSDIKTAMIAGITQFTNGQVILPFEHAFSRVKVTVVPGTGFTATDIEGCKVEIEDMYKEAQINVAKKITDVDYLTGKKGSQSVLMHPVNGAIIIPKMVNIGTYLFTIRDREGNKIAFCKAVEGKNTFNSGNLYEITLTVVKAGIHANAVITNWTENNVEMGGDQWLD